MRRNKGLLNQVECFVGLADKGSRKPEYWLAIATYDFSECRLSAGYTERSQFAVGQGRPIEAHPWSSVSAFTTAASNWGV